MAIADVEILKTQCVLLESQICIDELSLGQLEPQRPNDEVRLILHEEKLCNRRKRLRALRERLRNAEECARLDKQQRTNIEEGLRLQERQLHNQEEHVELVKQELHNQEDYVGLLKAELLNEEICGSLHPQGERECHRLQKAIFTKEQHIKLLKRYLKRDEELLRLKSNRSTLTSKPEKPAPQPLASCMCLSKFGSLCDE